MIKFIKKLHLRGYAKTDVDAEWQKVRDDAIIECPISFNSYDFLQQTLSQTFKYWIITFDEVE